MQVDRFSFLGHQIAGAVFIFPERLLWTLFILGFGTTVTVYPKIPVCESLFQFCGTAFMIIWKQKMPGQHSVGSAFAGAVYISGRSGFWILFLFRHWWYIWNRTSVGKSDGGPAFHTYILWELFFRLNRIAGQAKTVCTDSSVHYKYYTALHRYYSLHPDIAQFAGSVMRVRRFLGEGAGLCRGFVGA